MMVGKRTHALAVAMGLLIAGSAGAQIRITEYMYSGTDEEFVELTNVGGAPIDMTDWSFDDDSETPGTQDLSGFGIVDPGESVILTEADPTAFDAAWGLGGAVTILQNTEAGLGRNDSIVIYDDTDAVADRLDYGDEDFPFTFRTQETSAWACAEGLGANDPYLFNQSIVADSQGTSVSTGGDVGSPGVYVSVDCLPRPTGACCNVGACSDPVSEIDCLLAGGVYEGDGTNCGTTNCPQPADGDVRITEYMYTGEGEEFVEFTNFDNVPVNLTGWSFDDDSQTPGTVDLSAIGELMPGESAILMDGDIATFEAAWGLSGVKIAENAFAGLGRADEINLYNSTNTLKDRLTYGDEDFPGTIRTNGNAGWPCDDVTGANDITGWQVATVGDGQGSYASTDGDIGSPGVYVGIACDAIPTGACCDVGTCTDETATSCILGARDFQGDGTDCGTFDCPLPTGGAIRITEYMYSGEGDEFIEFTNMDAFPIDMTGWSYDDDSAGPGTVDLSAFGTLDPGESAILTEGDALTFESDWGLSGLSIIGGLTENIGRSDQINLFDSGGVLADRITYSDQTFPGTIRTQGASGWPCETAVGNDNIFDWFLSFVADPQGSYMSANGDIGNPGAFVLTGCEFCGNGRIEAGEQCDGGDCCTAQCTIAPADTVCRDAAGVCDLAEVCDGQTADCPGDSVASADTICRAAVGDCDADELCDGEGVDCPMDGVLPADTVCRESTGGCDPEEVCDGAMTDCPGDVRITICMSGDGCCPPGCNTNIDTECPPVCGNGILEPLEICDDGNMIDGDGCSSACELEFDAIPTVSQWGLGVMTLLLLISGKVFFGRRHAGVA